MSIGLYIKDLESDIIFVLTPTKLVASLVLSRLDYIHNNALLRFRFN